MYQLRWLAFFVLCSFLGHAQKLPEKSFTVKYVTEEITLDGVLDDYVWELAEAADNFWEYFPVDSLPARKQTEIKMLYDDTNLYIGITVHTAGEDYAIQSLRRDFRAGNSDNITLLFDTQSNEQSTWVQIPQNQNIFGLTFMGDMRFERPLGKSRTPMAIIPYIAAGTFNDRENSDQQNSFSFGGDSKISVGNSMNLDVTINPDFSQVEVDDQVTNLSWFEVALPEKRQFFIDNIDLFADFGGARDANPFFSRRIGIAEDTTGSTIENPIVGGVRLSGKLNPKLRLGFFSIQTEKDAANEIPSNNNTMLALQHVVFSRSNIGFFFINRVAFGSDDFITREERFNRVVGLDYNLISENNLWNGRFYMHRSFQPDVSGKDLSTGASLRYNSRYYGGFLDWVYIGENFRSDLGFVRRTDIVKGSNGISRTFWPEDSYINNHRFQFFGQTIWQPSLDMQLTDYRLQGSWEAQFRDQSGAEVQLRNQYTYLFDDFDPTGSDGIPLPAGSDYYYNSVRMQYRSDRRRIFSYSLESTLGGFFNGERLSLEAGANLRIQPKAFIGMQLRYDRISLPDPYPSADIWLVVPRIEVTFSKSIFWNTLIQYSNQRDNLGINTRLQWRFAPLSDLFLVYTDNYFVNSFSPKLRTINLKLTYWLNI